MPCQTSLHSLHTRILGICARGPGKCLQIAAQQRIALELKDKMAYAEKLKANVGKQMETIKALPQAILRKAFSGEL